MIPPILSVHTKFYNQLNTLLMNWLKSSPPPAYFTANFVTYGRTLLLYPALFFWWCAAANTSNHSQFFSLIVACIVILVDFGDFLDGVLARYWVAEKKKAGGDASVGKNFPNPTVSRAHLNNSYGAYIDAVLDKVFIAPLWIYSISTLTFTTWIPTLISFTILFSLITIEGYSAYVRTKGYFLQSGGVAMEVIEEKAEEGEGEGGKVGEDAGFREVFMSSAKKRNGFSGGGVKADSVGKCKQTLEMMGTAMLVGFGGGGRILGLFVLNLAVPMAYESVSRKVKKRVILLGIEEKENNLKANLKLINSVTNICSQLWVVCSPSSVFELVKGVDATIAELPETVNADYLDDIGADFYLVEEGGARAGKVDADVFKAGRCIVVGKDGKGRISRGRGGKKSD
ncbi:hypothetical protein TrST_g6761 [Triparma strigata]|nr:hypothetical protein TrST_g6761 [Triparma strigata]